MPDNQVKGRGHGRVIQVDKDMQTSKGVAFFREPK